MPTIAVARTEERHRSFDGVLALVREALDHIGGMEAFVKAGQSVLIKPDHAAPYRAESGCTTDPLVVGALIRLAREAGAGQILVAESSQGGLDSIECMRATGMAAMAEQEGAEVVDLGGANVPNREVEIPGSELLEPVLLPVPLLEADVIIAAPKAKTDWLDSIAGAIQLWAGMVSQSWRASHDAADAAKPIADIMTAVRPDLCVTDALICGEGDGPRATVPRWCGCILASTDPVATDVAIASLLGRDPRRLRFAAAGEERGLGRRAPIVSLGTKIERIAFDAWPGHPGFEHLPVNVLLGNGVTRAGTIGTVKSALDTLLRGGVLEQTLAAKRTPTVMIGDTVDPEFERHLAQGPYFVFDDAARPAYKTDPRVCFVGGHPVVRDVVPQMTDRLRPKGPQTVDTPFAAERPAGDGRLKRWIAAALALSAALAVGMRMRKR